MTEGNIRLKNIDETRKSFIEKKKRNWVDDEKAQTYLNTFL